MKENDLLPLTKEIPVVGVLIATHNPNTDFLREQLDSIASQRNVRTIIYWCDDNSNQNSLKRATEVFSNFTYIRVYLPYGKSGVNENFLNLLKAADNPEITYFAFSDQDDIWHAEKVARHIQGLAPYVNKVAASHSNVRAFGDVRKPFTVRLCQRHELKTLLAENCAQGCTMLLNKKARELVLSADSNEISWYDWWIASIVAIKGELVLIEGIDTFYRIHEDNLTGLPTFKKRLYRFLSSDSKRNLAQARNLSIFANRNQQPDAFIEIEKWIQGHSGSKIRRVKFALTDRKRRLRIPDDLLRRVLNLIRLP